MPIYSFICNQCRKSFDLLVGVNAEKTARVCPDCGSRDVQQALSAFSVGHKETGGCKSSGDCPSSGSCPMAGS